MVGGSRVKTLAIAHAILHNRSTLSNVERTWALIDTTEVSLFVFAATSRHFPVFLCMLMHAR